MALSLQKGDITNPIAWQDQAGHVPPSEFGAVPATANYPLNGDGRYWWNANSGTYNIPTRILNHFDTDIFDATGDATWTIQGAAALTASNPKFGAQCLGLNGSGSNNVLSALTTPIVAGGPLDILKGDFTIECWVRTNALNVNTPIVWDYGDFANSTGIRLYFLTNGGVVCQGSFFHFWGDLQSNAGRVTAGATYYHIAVCRQGNNGYLFVNGVGDVGGVQTNWTGTNPTGPIAYIGRSSNSGVQPTYFDGAVDEFRVSAFARYTSNFTPPAAPFTMLDTLPAPITFIGDPLDLTGTMALTWQLTGLSSDGSVPSIWYSTDGGVTFNATTLPLGQQGLQSGKINVALAGATGIIVSPKFTGPFVPGATLTNLAIAITRNDVQGPVWNFPDGLNPVNYNCDRLDNNGYPSDTLASLRKRILIRLGYSNQSTNPPPGMADLVNDFLSGQQKLLYRQYTALHTRRFFRWKLVPGQRFYSLLDNDEDVLSNFHMDPNKTIEWAGIQDNRNVWYPLIEGISPQLYTMITKPWRPARYEIKQGIEVYPAPDQTYWLWMRAHFGLLSFSQDSDTTTLDSELVFLSALAVAKAHYGQQDASIVEKMAETYRGELIFGTHGTRRYIPGSVEIPPAVRPTLLHFES